MSSLYTEAGVNIDAGSRALALFKADVESTRTASVLTSLGSFASLYSLKEIINNYQDPVLVQSIDGVGTKLSVAKLMNKFDTVGEDIVNHSCNDILAMGAKPLTFLDYVAHDKLNPEIMASIVSGMCKACRENDLALVGGETAEMPGTYRSGEHDIAGAITGVVEHSKIITGKNIQEGDLILGLSSSGLHTNGYSLARKALFDQAGFNVNDKPRELNGYSIGEALLEPHLSYSKPILEIIDAGIEIKGIVHITGGGFYENIPRIVNQELSVQIDKNSFPVLPIFSLIQKSANVDDKEMYRVFNMGIGLILFIKQQDLELVEKYLINTKFKCYSIGKVVKNSGERVILK